MPITVSGTQITFNDGTNQTTAFTGGAGTVTSVATGNGLQGGTITTSGTLSVACPAANTVGSYCMGGSQATYNLTFGSNYAAGSGGGQISVGIVRQDDGTSVSIQTGLISGTWKWLGRNESSASGVLVGLACRVS
jgi:hypothetical protein